MTSLMRMPVAFSTPFMSDTTIASAWMCGPATFRFSRRAWLGTDT